jgi:nucleoside permease NupC
MIRPFLKDMTMSELHAILTGGFATIAGSVMAAYILYGVSGHAHGLVVDTNMATKSILYACQFEHHLLLSQSSKPSKIDVVYFEINLGLQQFTLV